MHTGCLLRLVTLYDFIKKLELFVKKLTDIEVKKLKPEDYGELNN